MIFVTLCMAPAMKDIDYDYFPVQTCNMITTLLYRLRITCDDFDTLLGTLAMIGML